MDRLRRTVTVALIAALGVVAPAVCATGAAAPAAEQMTCCKAGHHTCDKKDSSSDCCKKKGSRVAQVGVSTLTAQFELSTAPPIGLPVVHASVNAAVLIGSVTAISFKRPHDPPHLHSFALLI